MSKKNYEGHRKRVRQKFLETKLAGFGDHEKLELLLFYARPGIDTKDIAYDLLKEFKTIAGVFDASIDQLMEIGGIGEAAAILIKLIPEMSKEYINSKSNLMVMDNYKTVCDYFKNKFIGEKNEIIMAACVDDRLRLISCVKLSEGTPSSADMNIRKLVEFTYKHNCESIILAHNHPNGDLIPSDDDIRVTKEIYKFLKPVGITLLDHIIAAGGEAISLREAGAFTIIA